MSIPLSVDDICFWTGGDLIAGNRNTKITGVSIDSRTVRPQELFIAIRGEKHDSHQFLNDAADAGASALLIERECIPSALPSCTIIEVDDTTIALGALANGHRRGFDGPLIGITGSSGKSTTKEMCSAILATCEPSLKTYGNLNNKFGLPLTLLNRDTEHKSVVVEIGMNHPGEIEYLASIAQANVGIITNIGSAHIEHLKSQEAIAREKGALIAALPPDGVAILNADDPRVIKQRIRTKARVLTFGLSPKADVRADRIKSLGEHGFVFDLIAHNNRQQMRVEGIGDSTIINALAAAAATLAVGITIDGVSQGLADYKPLGSRMEQINLPRNIVVIDDTYNANPQSMSVALRSLIRLKEKSRGIAVLGDMGELGNFAEEAHEEIGRLAANIGIDFLFTLGERSKFTARGARVAGMHEDCVWHSHSYDETIDAVIKILKERDWILVKGSRSMHMENIIEQLAKGFS